MALKISALIGSCVLLAACAHPGPPFLREPMPENPALAQVIADVGAFQDRRVRWGGNVVSVENRAEGTAVEIVERRLDKRGRPAATNTSAGRFVATTTGFLDPMIYTQGREVTIAGTIAGEEPRKIGEFEYRYVVVKTDNLYLWEPIQPVPPPMYYDPWYYDPWYRWPPWWYRRH
jgi:outer membrane lipoprotein